MNKLKILLEKLANKTINNEEKKELLKLLEERKRYHEENNDYTGSILTGILIFYLLN